MITREQAREQISAAIEQWRANEGEDRRPLQALADEAGVSVSMLYQFVRKDGPSLGPGTVSALQPLLPPIDPGVWLAAMGVQAPGAADGPAATA